MIDAEIELHDLSASALPTLLAAARRAGLLGGELVLQRSRDIVPIEEGTLERSGQVTQDGDRVAVSYDTPYAVRQHEDLSLQHDSGRSAKYLELAVAESRRDIERIAQTQLRRAAGG